jgi:hypothetical protein
MLRVQSKSSAKIYLSCHLVYSSEDWGNPEGGFLLDFEDMFVYNNYVILHLAVNVSLEAILKTFVICLLAILIAIPAWGQWEYGGKQIGYGPIGAIGLQPRLCPDDSGGVYVVWTAYLDDRPGREIFLCHFDTAGTELFGQNGLLITNDSLDQSMPAISPDGYGGCYVVWTDHRDFPDRQHGTLYAQRITYSGEMLWGNGIRLFYIPGYAPNDYPLRGTDIYSDTSIGLLAVCKLDTGYQKAVLITQRVNADGNRLWDSLGVIIHSDSGVYGSTFNQPHLINSGDNYFCAWRFVRGIKLQKIDLLGRIIFGIGGISIIDDINGGSGNPDDDRAIQLLPDGSGGIISSWIYDDLSLGTTLRGDRISSSGQSLWQANGKILLPWEHSQRWALGLHKIGSGSSMHILAVVLGGYQANYQIMDLTGNLLLGDQGGVFTNGTFFASTDFNDTLYFVQELDTLYYYYFGSKRDASGNEHWPTPPYIHGWIDDNLEIIPDRLGGMYVTFVLYRDFRTDWVYIQRIYPDGHFGGDTTAISESDTPLLPESAFNLTNYPNPFNSSTTISIGSPKDIRVIIYDITGKKVASILAESGKAIWDAAGFSSGIYFARADGENISRSIKLILLK